MTQKYKKFIDGRYYWYQRNGKMEMYLSAVEPKERLPILDRQSPLIQDDLKARWKDGARIADMQDVLKEYSIRVSEAGIRRYMKKHKVERPRRKRNPPNNI